MNGDTNGAVLGPSRIERNFAQGDEAVFAVFYVDNGASHYLVTHNVCRRAPLAWAGFLTGDSFGALPATNSRLEYLWYWGDDVLDPRVLCDKYNCTEDTSSIVRVPAQQGWPEEAQRVIDEAGAAPAETTVTSVSDIN